MEEETIAKNNIKRELAESTDGATPTEGSTSSDQLDGERPEMPEEMENMGGGPIGGENGGLPGQMTTMAASGTNEWLIPMTATGIISGAIALATVTVCLTMFFLNKKKN